MLLIEFGKDVATDDVPLAGPHGRRRLGVLEFLDQQGVASDDARVGPPAGDADDDDENRRGARKDGEEADQEEQVGDGEEGVEDAHHHGVDDAADEARHHPVDGAHDDGDESRQHAQRERVLAAVHDATEFVEPTAVGAQPVVSRRRRVPRQVQRESLVCLIGVIQHGAEVAKEQYQDEIRHRGDRQLVVHENSNPLTPERDNVVDDDRRLPSSPRDPQVGDERRLTQHAHQPALP